MSRSLPVASPFAPVSCVRAARRALLAGGLLWGAMGFAAEKAAPAAPTPPPAAPSAPAKPSPPPSAPATPGKPDFAKEVGPLIKKYCFDCHTGDEPEGDFSLYFESERDFTRRASSERAHFEKMYDFLREYEMPPRKKPQPSNAEREKILEWIDATMLATPADKAEATSLRGGKFLPGLASRQRPSHPAISWQAPASAASAR